jgi:hypothetical protein
MARSMVTAGRKKRALEMTIRRRRKRRRRRRPRRKRSLLWRRASSSTLKKSVSNFSIETKTLMMNTLSLPLIF